MENLTLEQKVYQMFILGYEGENPHANPEFINALKSGLGGVIFLHRIFVTKKDSKLQCI